MTRRRFVAAALAGMALSGLTLSSVACDREEGPFEEAGEALDDAVDDVEDAAK